MSIVASIGKLIPFSLIGSVPYWALCSKSERTEVSGVVEPETFLQRVHCRHLFLAQAEPFNSQVVRHPRQVFRLWNDRVTPLHAPTQHHLPQESDIIGGRG